MSKEKMMYEVEVPLRGTLYYHVEATSKADAMRQVNEGAGMNPVENSVDRSGRAKSAKAMPDYYGT